MKIGRNKLIQVTGLVAIHFVMPKDRCDREVAIT